MTSDHLHLTAQNYLQKLCIDIPERPVGSFGNQLATEFFAETIASFSFRTECPQFTCMDWESGEVELRVGDQTFDVHISPFSLGCEVQGEIIISKNIRELESIDAKDKLLFLHGEIVKEQLMPKNFTFFNPEGHQRIYSLLEEKQPLAIIAATSRNPELAGGIYPFPLIEDGDFDIPSVYMKDEEGTKILDLVGKDAMLKMSATRHPSTGCNVLAWKGGDAGQKIVVCAHIDAKENSPGALDNGTGVVILLLLAELMKEYQGQHELEIIAINGEDYYAASGEVQYVERMKDRWDEILLAINMDGAGFHRGETEYSLYDCPEKISGPVKRVLSSRADFREGSPWFQSDHSIFLQNGRPAVAITSDNLMELSTNITHTPKDHPDLVDAGKLVDIAEALKDAILEIDASYSMVRSV